MKLKCSAPTTLGKCDAFEVHRTDSALDQGRDFDWVLGHSLQFSSGILAKQVLISKSITVVDLSWLLEPPQGQLESL